MQITSVTDTNYIGNPSFENDITGWSVSNGVLYQYLQDSYSGGACGQFIPNANYAFISYNLTNMSTGLFYVAQARVKAGAGQLIFIQFPGGQSATSQVATGGWDLIVSQPYLATANSFDVEIGIGYALEIVAIDRAQASESVTYSVDYGLRNTQIFENPINTTETFQIVTDGGWLFLSDINASASDSVVTAESYSIQVGAGQPFNSGSLYLLSVTDNITGYDAPEIIIDESTDRTIYVDAVMLEQAMVAGNYFDGNSGNGYHWNGSANESTSYYRQFEVASASTTEVPDFGVLISWTRQYSSDYTFFTIGTSVIGGPDFIPGTSAYPTYFNQYQYGEYSTYLLGVSIARNIGQYPYGAFGAQLDLSLDNTDLTFLPGYDPVIGNYIVNGRPVMFQMGFNGEMINLFAGLSTKPANDIQNRTLSITAFDGMDYLNSFISHGAGPIASANGGMYYNLPAQTIIGDLLQEAGFSTSQYVFEQSLQSNIGFLSPSTYVSNSTGGNTGSIGAVIADICEAEQALFFFDENGVAQFWNREHIPTNQTVQWDFAYKSIVNYQTEDTPILNDVIVQAQPRAVQATQNIWQLTESTIIPPATTTMTHTNMAINPTFASVTGGYFNSPLTLAANENVSTTEFVLATLVPYNARGIIFDSTQISENIAVQLVFANFMPQLYDSAATYESISVKVGSNAQYNSPRTISVADSAVTTEFVYVIHTSYRHVQLVFSDYAVSQELVSVNLVDAPFKPVVSDSAATYEAYNINTTTMTGWGTSTGASIVENTSDGAPDGNDETCGLLTTNGANSSYLYQNFTVTPNTQYVGQCQVKGLSGTGVTMQFVENNNVIATNTITLDGSWDVLSVEPFNTDNTNTQMQLRIFANTAGSIKIDSVMVQNGVGALTAYFDGNSSPTSSYTFSWSGGAYTSTSVATPCGSATIVADFQDADGDLPVFTIDEPVYNNSTLDSSYLTNLNADGSGIAGSSFIQLQKATLNGSTYTMTFINTYSQPIYITELTLYGQPAKVTYTISQEYKDPTSIALYGTNPANNGLPLVINNNLIQDPSTALSNAYSLVNDYANPYQRILADVFPAYMLQIGDVVSATIDDTGQTLDYNIVGITNGVSNDGEPLQQLELEVKKLVHYFTINTSVIGGTDSIAP